MISGEININNSFKNKLKFAKSNFWFMLVGFWGCPQNPKNMN